NPEGYLFPATYTLPPGTPPLQVLQAMVKRFKQEASSVKLPATAVHDQLSQADVITVASLVQAEGRDVKDFPKIARVIYNRLNTGMKLQLDSTVMYALHTYGIMASNQQLKVNSPYNTYQHTGLPPGPIDSPGDAAIRAALHPAAGNWLYFVTVNPKTGQTEFTSDPAVFQQLRAELAKNLKRG
ncbi:MAG: endolytic transglycosylase MltG, partial [Actinobacteria bacterium]|nr:endolytic transglycosylase MltG [Actinomycetota bacterium]